ncbi:MAG: hypothetical protein ACM65M_03860 [Microcoleus sp.]
MHQSDRAVDGNTEATGMPVRSTRQSLQQRFPGRSWEPVEPKYRNKHWRNWEREAVISYNPIW